MDNKYPGQKMELDFRSRRAVVRWFRKPPKNCGLKTHPKVEHANEMPIKPGVNLSIPGFPNLLDGVFIFCICCRFR